MLGSTPIMPGAVGPGVEAGGAAAADSTSQQRWHTQVIYCPKAKVGRVIGKEGITIKGLQSFTGGMIQIDQTSDPTRVTVAGTKEAMALCVDLIQDIVAGQFKGFAMLKQWLQDVENEGTLPKGPSHVAPLRPLYVKGYGFVPPSQLGAKPPDAVEAHEPIFATANTQLRSSAIASPNSFADARQTRAASSADGRASTSLPDIGTLSLFPGASSSGLQTLQQQQRAVGQQLLSPHPLVAQVTTRQVAAPASQSWMYLQQQRVDADYVPSAATTAALDPVTGASRTPMISPGASPRSSPHPTGMQPLTQDPGNPALLSPRSAGWTSGLMSNFAFTPSHGNLNRSQTESGLDALAGRGLLGGAPPLGSGGQQQPVPQQPRDARLDGSLGLSAFAHSLVGSGAVGSGSRPSQRSANLLQGFAFASLGHSRSGSPSMLTDSSRQGSGDRSGDVAIAEQTGQAHPLELLPLGWRYIRDPDGRGFYHNLITSESVWQLPPAVATLSGGTAVPVAPESLGMMLTAEQYDALTQFALGDPGSSLADDLGAIGEFTDPTSGVY